jgi:hypothetical protein
LAGLKAHAFTTEKNRSAYSVVKEHFGSRQKSGRKIFVFTTLTVHEAQGYWPLVQ